MSVAQPIDVRDMRIIHATFRSVYDESARLLRSSSATAPDPGSPGLTRPTANQSVSAWHIAE